MTHAWIGLGTNLGERAEILACAIHELAVAGLSVLRVSHLYETRPEGGVAEPPYLNAVVQAETDADPSHLLELLHAIEERLGRDRARRSGPRTLDLDLLALGETVQKPPRAPVLPHPRLHLRTFVMVPLCELDPLWRHPVLQRTAGDLLSELPYAPGEVRLFGRAPVAREDCSQSADSTYPWRNLSAAR